MTRDKLVYNQCGMCLTLSFQESWIAKGFNLRSSTMSYGEC